MNNFTVLLVEKPQDPELLEKLFERLQTSFKLSPEQARTLANKPAGPLLKATTEARAKQVAALYSSMGIEVRIVDLAQEAPRAAPVRQVVAARATVSASKPEGSSVLEREPSPPPMPDSSGVEDAPVRRVVGAPTPAADTAELESPAPLERSRVVARAAPAEDDHQSVSIRPTIAAPASALGEPTDATTPPPSISMRTRPSVDAPRLTPAEPGPTSTAPGNTRSTVVSAPSSTTSTGRTEGESADRTETAEAGAEGMPALKKRRTSLQTRVLLTTLLPLVILSVAVLGFLALSLPRTLGGLIQEGARQLAISVGNSVDLEDLSGLTSQLESLTTQPNVGFVAVKSPVVDQFRTKVNGQRIDLTVNSALQEYLTANPEQATFSWSDDVAGYTFLRAQDLERDGGTLSSIKQNSYEKQIADVSTRPVNSYAIVQTGVYETDGRRTFGVPDAEKATFIVTVGVITNDSQTTIRNAILVALFFSVLIVVGSTLLAIFTARRITRPILGLVDAANEISLGKLDNPVQATTNDEIGDLAGALERMRVSLGAALERLRRRRR